MTFHRAQHTFGVALIEVPSLLRRAKHDLSCPSVPNDEGVAMSFGVALLGKTASAAHVSAGSKNARLHAKHTHQQTS